VRAFEQQGIVATPKHFVCNYGDGGRDSNAPEIGWREAREVYLPPFKACVQEAGARGIMAAYNSFDGVPCHCNRKLLTDILRREWGFKGIVVSDYGGVEGIENAQDTAVPDGPFRRAIEAGLEVALPDSGGRLAVNMKSVDKDADALDRAVLRVLRLKFELGLFENPFGDAAEADRIVRCQAHRDLALEAARKSMVLLKNKNGVLPLKKDIKTLGVFGSAARKLQLGGYSAPYGCDGKREGAVTAFDGLGKALPAGARLVESLADVKQCETVLYFVDINEGEGSDRSDCGLSAAQEDEIQTLAASGVPIVVVMFNGSAVTMRRWVDKVDAVLEAWYPGEQGGTAVAEALFGWLNPAGRLPITFPKSEGQMPLYYNQKPSGRGYGYVGDDGKPLFPFGYGLSYTKFVYSDLVVGTPKVTTGEAAKLSVRVANTGDRDGDEVVQLYIHLPRRSVVTPLKELKGFKRVTLKPGAAQTVEFTLGPDDLSVWDANMKWVNEPGHVEIMVGGSSEDIRLKGEFEVHSK